MNPHDKKLLVISNQYPAGPDDISSPFVYRLHRALHDLNIKTDFVVPHFKPYGDGEPYIVESIHRFEFSDSLHKVTQWPQWNLMTGIEIMRYLVNGRVAAENLILRKGYNAVLALGSMLSGLIARKLWKKYNIPYAVWDIGNGFVKWNNRPFCGRVVNKSLLGADRIFADGYKAAENIQLMIQKECQYLPAMYESDEDQFAEKKISRSFVYLGRIDDRYGVFDLLNAFRLFNQKKPDWKLHFIGTGRAEHSLQLAISSLGLTEAVINHGYIKRVTVNSILNSAAAVIIPPHDGSLPSAFGEAMRVDLPVICSRIGDMPYYVKKYRVGYLFESGNVDDLKNKMLMMTENFNEPRKNCRFVFEEASIMNSARSISRWLDSINSQPPLIEHAKDRSKRDLYEQ